jgi:hypothetical protein
MEPDPSEPTGDLSYDMAHEVTGAGAQPQGETRQSPAEERRDDAAGDYGYDEAHDFRR